jgi:diguanylate cyclase (GGDEF)-like protein/PAS domain S-box-containing protein
MTSAAPSDGQDRPAGASRWKSRLAYLLACFVAVALYLSGVLEFAERQIDEATFAVSQRPASGDVVLVEIDARSLKELGVWPWPRRMHATVVRNLLAAGAARIAFDVDFSAHSRDADDHDFAAALMAAEGRVVLPVFQQRSSNTANSSDMVASMPAARFRPYVDLAIMNVFPSGDGIVRHLFVDGEIGGQRFPSLAALLADGKPMPNDSFDIDFGIDPATVPRLAYTDILKGRFRPEDVAGKQIVIGSTAAELGDLFAVPYRITLPGPLVHILGFESIAQARMLQRVAPLPIILVMIALTFCLGGIFERLSFGRSLAAAGATACTVVLVAVLLQARFVVVVDTAPLLLLIVFAFVAAMAIRLDHQSIRLLLQTLAIRRKDTMMRSLIEKSIVGVIICDEGNRIESINPAAAAMFGYDMHALDGVSIGRIVPDLAVHSAEEATPLADLAEVGYQAMWGQQRDGAVFPVEITANKVEVGGQCAFVAFVNDITQRRKHEEELQYRADHDLLTGLPNRTMFTRELSVALTEAQETGAMVAVYLLDLDRFKDVNDTLGHTTGDRLLQDVAQRLSLHMPEGALLSRFGGDEFAMYLPYVLDIGQVEQFAGGIISGLRQPFDVDQVSLEVGGSLGYALFPENGATTDILLQRADIAMYSAKRFQSGFSKYWAEDDAHSVRNLTLTGDLRRAIEEDELELAFQPKIDLATGTVTGAEVLCRWNRPEHGFVRPDEFIGHAEQSGLIFPLTRWVLGKAVETAAIWREFGWDLNIAVNLSARLLHHEEILSLVAGTLEQWEFPAGCLTLEITENALLVNPAHAMIVIGELAAQGIKVSIDDFGTGYSSLSYLTTLDASELKIDKSFVLGMSKEDNFKTVVKSVIAMAHDLNLRVVAEGIESEEVVAILRGFGCDIGQGFLFGKPMAAAAFETFLKTSACPNLCLSARSNAESA